MDEALRGLSVAVGSAVDAVAIVLSENMSDQLRAFKVGSLKMEVTA